MPPRPIYQHSGILFPLAACAWLAFAASACLAQAQTTVPPIRVDVNVVTVPVTVSNPRGEFVGGLRRENFRLRLDGEPQPINYFAAEEEPAEVLILVETGPAVYLLRDEHFYAAAALLNGLAPGDRVAVATYEQSPQVLVDFSTDKQVAAAALNSLVFGLGTAQLNLYDSLAKCLDWLANTSGKRAIVALTTGLDSSGPAAWLGLAQRLQRSNVMVLPVALGANLRNPAFGRRVRGSERSGARPVADVSEEFAEFDRALAAIAEETGGRIYSPSSPAEFESAYRQIASLLRHQYSLGFNSRAQDGRYHHIEVELVDSLGEPLNKNPKKPDYRWNSRRGFLAASP
jgi:Ca-activated chloride channel family protein